MEYIIGQDRLLTKLNKLIEVNNDFPHFSILIGARGSGKKLIANYIATAMKTHIVHIGYKVDEIRDMIKNSYQIISPIIYLISDADTMSEAARATILKIAEEPPQNVYIIMTLEFESNTLPTILSRATVFHLDKYKPSEISDYFSCKTHTDTIEDKQTVISLCETPGEVNLLIDMGITDFCGYVDLVFNHISNVSGANSFKIADKINLKGNGGYDLKLFLKAFSNRCIRSLWDNLPQSTSNNDIALYSKYFSGVMICQRYIDELKIASINKGSLFDMWILSIRSAWTED